MKCRYNNVVMSKIDSFLKLANIFENHKHHLCLVGGTVRDYVSAVPLTDMDAVTDATPEEMKSILDPFKADYTFARMGSVKVIFDDVKFDIVTLRKESNYDDYRHPKTIKFIKSKRRDSLRRDFTLNAMYLDNTLNVLDYHHGRRDLEKNILRMVGNPNKRIKEDPLRIIRAIRFSLTYGYHFDKKLEKAIYKNVELVNKLNEDKIKEEIRKMNGVDENKIIETFATFNIKCPLKVVK